MQLIVTKEDHVNGNRDQFLIHASVINSKGKETDSFHGAFLKATTTTAEAIKETIDYLDCTPL